MLPKRVLIIGAESSGKTTLAKAMANHCGEPWVPEYGRQLFEEKEGHLDFEDYLTIAETQVTYEKIAMMVARRFVFCDTSPLVTKFYCEQWEKRVDPKLAELADEWRYDHVVICARDFGYVDDGTRSGEAFGQIQEDYYFDNLKQPFYVVFGSISNRINQVLNVIEGVQ